MTELAVWNPDMKEMNSSHDTEPSQFASIRMNSRNKVASLLSVTLENVATNLTYVTHCGLEPSSSVE